MTKELMNFEVAVPTFPIAQKLTKEDVWGKWDKDLNNIHKGMILAKYNDTCPIWGDKIPYKSVTVLTKADQVEEVSYWIEYVHGADSISAVKDVGQMIAIRSDYTCW